MQPYREGVVQVELCFGFMEEPDVEAALLAIDDERLGPIVEQELTFFLGRETIVASPVHGMADWREHLFALQVRSAASARRFFRLPSDRVVEVGSQVEI